MSALDAVDVAGAASGAAPSAPRPRAPAARDDGTERDRRLAAEGWMRRFISAPPRLQEAAGIYEQLGQEVRTEPLAPDELADECAGCRLALTVFRVLYTREPQ